MFDLPDLLFPNIQLSDLTHWAIAMYGPRLWAMDPPPGSTAAAHRFERHLDRSFVKPAGQTDEIQINPAGTRCGMN